MEAVFLIVIVMLLGPAVLSIIALVQVSTLKSELEKLKIENGSPPRPTSSSKPSGNPPAAPIKKTEQAPPQAGVAEESPAVPPPIPKPAPPQKTPSSDGG